MKYINQFFAFLLLFVCLLTGTSCGYHMGSLMHPQIKSIAFSEIRNDTKEPLLTAAVRSQIASQFVVDNSLKVTTMDKADCILYCRIAKAMQSTSRYTPASHDDLYEPAEFGYTITAEIEVLIPGRSQPLLKKRMVTGSAKYQFNGDPQSGKLAGMRQASYELARNIVQATTEAW